MMLPSSQVVVVILFTMEVLLAIPLDDNDDVEDYLYDDVDEGDNDIQCDTIGGPEANPLRNGLGDDSLFLWPDKKIPFLIGDGFNDTNKENILDSVADYNDIFKGCIEWVPKTNEAVYVEFLNSGSCYSRVGRAYWPFPLPQSIFIGGCAHLIGHIKHEMMHTLGFYHEHSRSDRDMYIKINWDNIADGRADQFVTYRWTTGFGEEYDYASIMHYSSTAFSKNPKEAVTIEPVSPDRYTIKGLGRRRNLSDIDVAKIKKLYKCPPFENWDNGCDSDSDCGINEHCAFSINVVRGQCRTQLSTGSFCLRNEECLTNQCSASGACSICTQDTHCPTGQFCANKYNPFAENKCTSYCGEFCLLSAQCAGSCKTCSWNFTCT